jgi:ketosteroid isomerase-like protein
VAATQSTAGIESLKGLDPEVEWHDGVSGDARGEATVYRAHEGVRDALRDLYETLSEFHADYPEIRDLVDRTVAIGRIRARGRASEAELESPHGTVVEFKNGKGVGFEPTSTPKRRVTIAEIEDGEAMRVTDY